MTWQERKPVFRIHEGSEGSWWWELENDGEVVATSIGEGREKQEILDFLTWLRLGIASIPIIGKGILSV
jgi:hypothetical protein